MATVTAPAPVSTYPFAISDRRQGIPPGIAFTLYATVTAPLLVASWRAADHHFVYALDDSYIAMAIAKSLALHGVWGVTRFAFSSASSSPLFTLVLASLYRLTGVHEATSLVISWSAGRADRPSGAGGSGLYPSDLSPANSECPVPERVFSKQQRGG